MELTLLDIIYLIALAVYIIMCINFKLTTFFLAAEEKRELKKLDNPKSD